MNAKQVLVVGIGSSHGDDQAGWLVIDQLKKRILLDPVNIQLATSPVDVLDWIDGVEQMIICDACRGLGDPGSIHCIRWPSTHKIDIETSGTHNLSLTAVLKLAEQLGRLPETVELCVIEGESSKSNEPPSQSVANASIELGQRLANKLAKNLTAESCTNNHS